MFVKVPLGGNNHGRNHSSVKPGNGIVKELKTPRYMK